MRAAGGYFRLLARRLLNGLQFFTGGVRWLLFLPAAMLLVPPALILPLLDSLDRDRNFTLGYLCTARKRADGDRRKRTTLDGVIVIDKPEGWTSHDVVNKVRRIAQTKKVGHLGTLDPIATGVLPLVIERATRLAQFYTRSDKIYEGVVRFGWSTSSYDRAGEPTSEKVEVHLTAEQLEAALEPFRGEIEQRPPAVSAKKVDGPPLLRTGAQEHRGGTGAGARPRLRTDPAGTERQRRALARALLGRHLHALDRARSGAGAGLRRAPHRTAQAGLAASSKSTRRARWSNWKRWPPKTAWWTRSCRAEKLLPAFRACSWMN